MAKSIVIIGAGPAGYQAAIRAAQLGGRVALVEQNGLGGTCLHWGCIPTKTLMATAEALHQHTRLSELALEPGGPPPHLNLEALRQRRAGVIQVQEKGIAGLLKAHGVELISGTARLSGPGRVSLRTAQGNRELACDGVILASGSLPGDLKGLERDGRLIWNSDDALKLESIPASLCVVGGGVIGCELAVIYSCFGADVTVVEALDRLLPLPSLEPEISKTLAREMKKLGVNVQTSRVVSSALPESDGLRLTLGPSPLVERPPKKTLEITAQRALVAVGRRVNSDGLGLAEAGVDTEANGAVKVDSHLETSLAGVYAVGDLLGPGRPMLAHMASTEGLAAAANVLGADQRVEYDAVPSAIFTMPEAASVGLSLAQAETRGLDAVAHSFQIRALGRAQASGELAGVCRLVSDQGSGRLLGAHLIGARSTEIIAECTLALKMGATLEDLAETIHAHPTLAEGVREAAELALGRCVHAPPAR
jgi:dihydrolipoamide dehydrogenase